MPLWILVAFVVLLILKLAGVAIAWWVVFLPLIIAVVATVGFVLIFWGGIALALSAMGRAYKKQTRTYEEELEKKNGLR